MYEYNPAGAVFPPLVWQACISNGLSEPLAESKNSQQLLLRTEFHGQVEYRSSTLIARRPKPDPVLPQSKSICGGCLTFNIDRPIRLTIYFMLLGSVDRSLTSLTPVEETVAKILQLLQGQLTRNIQHVAGLNPRPKAFR
jgi:cleavage and polyadenylation specificity factor subunit 1